MKNFKLFFVIALFGAIAPIYGQGPYQADPTNYIQVAEDIYNDGTPGISVTQTEIEDHLEDVVTAYPFDPSGIPPTPVVDVINSSVIKVSWVLDPAADSYEVRYLNLIDGTTDIKNTSSNLVTFNGPTPGLYAISIVKLSYYQAVLQATFAEIIIAKEIVFFTIPDPQTCLCLPDQNVDVVELDLDTEGEPGFFILDFTTMFTGVGGGVGKYELTLNFWNETQKKLMITKTPIAESGFVANCYGDMIVEELYGGHVFVIYEQVPGLFPTAHLTVQYEQYQWYLNAFTGFNVLKDAFVSKCTPVNRSIEVSDLDGNSQLQIFPNPAMEQIQINSSSNKVGSLRITNQLGQIMHTKDFAFSSEEVIVKEWPKGVYHVKMTIKGKTHQETFVKID